MRHAVVSALCLFACADAAPRPWKSADGTRSVQGELVNRDATGITIRRAADRKEVVIPLDKLHPDDRTWLNANHPLPGTEAPAKTAVFDKLLFGDSRETVLEKLKASKFVEMTAAETFIGRTGLNGIFKTCSQVGGLDASLYFGWNEDGGLSEISLQTEALPAARLESTLKPCWKEFISLLTNLYGKPIHANDQLQIGSIADGSMNGTHLWKLEGQGSALLGAAREGDNYQIVVRFTRKEIQPVPLP